MKIKRNMEKEFEKCIEVNSHDCYSKFVIDYMIRWADMMEECISNGDNINDIAEKTSHEADTDGITGFMYGCAVDLLSRLWEYGEDLRKWHNKQYEYDGDGVVNPAIFTVKFNNEMLQPELVAKYN